MKAGKPSIPTIKSFLAKRLPSGSRVGIDPFVHSVAFVNDLEEVRVRRYCVLPINCSSCKIPQAF